MGTGRDDSLEPGKNIFVANNVSLKFLQTVQSKSRFIYFSFFLSVIGKAVQFFIRLIFFF